MTTKSRLISKLIDGKGVVKASVLDSDSIGVSTQKSLATISGTATYSSADTLPTSASDGDQALVTSTNRLYIYSGSGWYNIALVNNTPYWSTEASANYDLNKNGTSTTITILAIDSDGTHPSYSAVTDSDFDAIATISKDSDNGRVFIVTPIDSDNGTAIGGTGTVTFKASDGVNLVSTVSTFSIAFKIANSQYITLLVKANTGGTDNQVDASTNNLSITEYGDVTSTAFSPYHPAGYSVYFDGSGDNLTAPNIAMAGDITFEFWFYQDVAQSAAYRWLLGTDIYGASAPIAIYTNNTVVQVWLDGSGSADISGAFTAHTWHHVAVVRNSGTWTLYIDGTSQGTSTSYGSTDFAATVDWWIGERPNGSYDFTGYIKDARFVNGTAVYTSAFTPPTTQLTAVSGTSLLTCHLPYIADGSTNSHAITVNGNPSTKRFSPYDYPVAYTKADHGGSVYFDGNGDYMDVSTSTAADFGTGDFTVEVWWYPTTPTQNGVLWGGFTNATNTSNNVCEFYLGLSTGWLRPHINTNFGGTWTTRISTTEFCKDKTWNHVAYVRNGNVGNIYINGKKGPDNAIDATAEFNNPFNSLRVFRSWQTTTSYGKGYLADLRIVKGTAVYTADFTPPTVPLTAISNTELLTMTNKNNIWDANGQLLSKSGNVTASNTQRKFTTSSSMYFDGGGDYLSLPNALRPLSEWVNGDWTVELQIYTTKTANQNIWAVSSAHGAAGTSFGLWTGHTTNKPSIYVSNGSGYFIVNLAGTTTVTDGAWYHIAVTKSGNVYRIFVNGTQEATTTNSGTISTAATNIFQIGRQGSGTGEDFNGYIQDLRVSEFARYTTNFTAPTAEFEG